MSVQIHIFGQRGDVGVTVHPDQASPAIAENAFGFLTTLGFTLQERWVSGGQSFKDGWQLIFLGPKIQLVVQYLDSQFEVHFVRDGLEVSYLQLDRDLFGRRSGFHGDMFPPEKLGAAVNRIAEDIREHYGETLSGDEGEWERIARLKSEPTRPRHLP